MRFLKASALTASFLLNAVLLLGVASFLVAPVVLAKKKVSLQNVVEQLALLEIALTGKLEESVNVESMAASNLSTKLDELIEVASRAETSRWPPTGEDIVNMTFSGLPELFRSDLPLVLFSVPDGSWFVLTDYHKPAGVSFQLIEILGDEVKVKHRSSHPEFSSGVGIAFRPGSKVQYQYLGGVGTVEYFTLTGYLAD